MNRKTMIYVGVGILVGVIAADRLRQLPVVKSLPTI